MATILITGSTGYLCRFVVGEILKSTNHNIVATYRSDVGEYDNNPRLSFEKADLLEPHSFDRIFEDYKPDYLIHLAAMARVKDGENNPVNSFNANFTATYHLLGLADKYKLIASLIASSNLAQGAVSTVGISKLLTEQYTLKTKNINTKTILYRVPNILDSNGAVTHIFRRLIKNNQPITITHPDMSRSFITGENAAAEVLYLLKNGDNKGIYVSYKEPLKIINLAKQMMLEQGKDLPIQIIGMSPGEKLSEHVFTENDVEKTDIPYLGKLIDYNFNHNLTVNSIGKLNSKESIATDGKIQKLLASLF